MQGRYGWVAGISSSAPELALAFHPLANLFPLMEGAAFEELVAYVRQHCVREPVVLHQDKILRFFADCCCEKGAPSGQLEIKTPLYLPCPSWATD
jgi:hypothetical protein